MEKKKKKTTLGMDQIYMDILIRMRSLSPIRMLEIRS